jgi:hypothetical protein
MPHCSFSTLKLSYDELGCNGHSVITNKAKLVILVCKITWL